MKFKKTDLAFFIWSVVISYVAAVILHFGYDFLGRPFLLSGIMPVSESIWEHLKLVFYPLCIIFLFPWCEQIRAVTIRNRVVMTALAGIVGRLFVSMGYYGLKEGLSIEGIVSDLLLLFIAFILSIYHGFLLRRNRLPFWLFLVSCIYLAVNIILFYLFSFYPPNLPIF